MPQDTADVVHHVSGSESGRLVCDAIDFNDSNVLGVVLGACQESLSKATHWHRLVVERRVYFKTPDGPLPAGAGWYIACDGTRQPIYVGTAKSLDLRLNSANHSLDGFANSGRAQDPVRNFIKAFVRNSVLSSLCVGVVTEAEIRAALGIVNTLSKLDRCNIEKVLGLFRHRLVSASRSHDNPGERRARP